MPRPGRCPPTRGSVCAWNTSRLQPFFWRSHARAVDRFSRIFKGYPHLAPMLQIVSSKRVVSLDSSHGPGLSTRFLGKAGAGKRLRPPRCAGIQAGPRRVAPRGAAFLQPVQKPVPAREAGGCRPARVTLHWSKSAPEERYRNASQKRQKIPPPGRSQGATFAKKQGLLDAAPSVVTKQLVHIPAVIAFLLAGVPA